MLRNNNTKVRRRKTKQVEKNSCYIKRYKFPFRLSVKIKICTTPPPAAVIYLNECTILRCQQTKGFCSGLTKLCRGKKFTHLDRLILYMTVLSTRNLLLSGFRDCSKSCLFLCLLFCFAHLNGFKLNISVTQYGR